MPTETSSIYNTICARIIAEQEFIVGSLAWEIAGKVNGLTIKDRKAHTVGVSGDPKTVIDELVDKYEKVFGQFAHDVCKQAVSDIVVDMPVTDVPEGLR